MSIDHEDPRTHEQTQAPLPEVVAPATSEAPKNLSRRALLVGIGRLGAAGALVRLGMKLGDRGGEVVTKAKPIAENSATATESSAPETPASPEVVEPTEPELFTQEQLVTIALLEKASPETFETKTTLGDRLLWVLDNMHEDVIKGTNYRFLNYETRSGYTLEDLSPLHMQYTGDTDSKVILGYLMLAEQYCTLPAEQESQQGELEVALDAQKARKFVAATLADTSSKEYQSLARLYENYTKTNLIEEDRELEETNFLKSGYDFTVDGKLTNLPAKEIIWSGGNSKYKTTVAFVSFESIGVNVAGVKDNYGEPFDTEKTGMWIIVEESVL